VAFVNTNNVDDRSEAIVWEINEEGDKEVGNHYVEEEIGPLTTKSKGRQPEHWNNKK